MECNMKLNSHLPKKIIICFNERPLKMMKNVFYLVLKALFIFKIFKFLSWYFDYVEKCGLSRKITLLSKFMTLQPG